MLCAWFGLENEEILSQKDSKVNTRSQFDCMSSSFDILFSRKYLENCSISPKNVLKYGFSNDTNISTVVKQFLKILIKIAKLHKKTTTKKT